MKRLLRPKAGDLLAVRHGHGKDAIYSIAVYLGKADGSLKSSWVAYYRGYEYDGSFFYKLGEESNYDGKVFMLESADIVKTWTVNDEIRDINVYEYMADILDGNGRVNLGYVKEQYALAKTRVLVETLKDIGYKMMTTKSEKVKDECIRKVLRMNDVEFEVWSDFWKTNEQHRKNVIDMETLRVFDQEAA